MVCLGVSMVPKDLYRFQDPWAGKPGGLLVSASCSAFVSPHLGPGITRTDHPSSPEGPVAIFRR